jgi:CoA:oxalate CoA-transferase
MAMLDNIRILDLSRVLSGPYCSRMLADMGAEVIKVESLNGEPMRHYPPLKGNHSSYFTQWNVGKKSLCMDLRQKTAIDLIKKIVAKSDVVLQNFRPGTLEKMELGYDALKAVNPKIILCSISGFGQTGCESKRLAYTDIVQAYSGLDYLSSKMNNSDTDPQGFPVSFADSYASLNACVAILAALLHRDRTGEGQSIDISMLDALLASNDSTLQGYIFSDGQWERPTGIWRAPLKMKDGHMAVAVALQFERVVHAIGMPELLQHELYCTVEKRVVNLNSFLEIMKAWAGEKTVAEATKIFDEYDLPYSKVNSMAEIVNSEVVKERNMLVDVELAGIGKVPVVNTPFKFSGTETGPQGPSPAQGEHNQSILAELLGISKEDYADLVKNKVVWQDNTQEPLI